MDGELLRAIEIRTGISDGEFTEIVEVIGSRPDDVSGDQPAADAAGDANEGADGKPADAVDEDDSDRSELADGTAVVTGVEL